jgi:AraC-like DNA-binding protein
MYELVKRNEECVAYDSRLIYMISGDVSVSIDAKKPFHLNSGNLLYIPAGTSYKMRGQYLRMVVITFDLTDKYSEQDEAIVPSVFDKFDPTLVHVADISPFDRMLYCADMESECDTFINMYYVMTSGEGEWRATLSALTKIILIKLSESVSESALPSRMVESLDTYIRENCKDEISNTEIGAIFGYHPFYVSRVLKEKKGITLRQYIIAYRLKLAKKLLAETKMSAAEIAEECGFTDASYFTKTFRQTFGITPKDYRNQFKDNFI